MKYEKVFILLAIVFLFSSCNSTRIYSDGESATEARNSLAELQSGQAESSAAAAEIKSGIELITDKVDGAAEQSNELGNTIRTGTANDIEFAEILREIYSQPKGNDTKPPGADRSVTDKK